MLEIQFGIERSCRENAEAFALKVRSPCCLASEHPHSHLVHLHTYMMPYIKAICCAL